MESKQPIWSPTEMLVTTRIMLREGGIWSAVVLFFIVGLGLYHVISGAPLGASRGMLGRQSPGSPLMGGLAIMAFGIFLLANTLYWTHLARCQKHDQATLRIRLDGRFRNPEIFRRSYLRRNP